MAKQAQLVCILSSFSKCFEIVSTSYGTALPIAFSSCCIQRHPGYHFYSSRANLCVTYHVKALRSIKFIFDLGACILFGSGVFGRNPDFRCNWRKWQFENELIGWWRLCIMPGLAGEHDFLSESDEEDSDEEVVDVLWLNGALWA